MGKCEAIGPRGGRAACSAGGSRPASTSPVGEDPRDWLPAANRRPRCRPRRQRCRRERAGRPWQPSAHWLATRARPAAGPARRDSRSLPHGVEGARLMLLSDLPAREDAAEGKPIGGEAWALAHADARRDRHRRPTRPMSPRCPASTRPARGSTATIDACAAIARDHIRLARPRAAAAVRRRTGPRPARRAAGRGRAAGFTGSKGCARSPPSIRAGCCSGPPTRRSPGAICCC